MLLALAILAGVLAAGALVPSPLRDVARVVLAFIAILSPVLGVAYALTQWDRATFGAYLALLPLAFAWLAFIDLRCGVSARLERRPGRERRHP